MNEPQQKLYSLLGDLPARDYPISVETIAVAQHDGYHLETLLLDLNGIEPVPAYFAKPTGATGPLPVVLYNHAHGGDYVLGKEEPVAGRSHLQKPTYAKVLTDAGYAMLCIDEWVFGERRGRTESSVFKEMLWKGQVLWGMMLYDGLRALDYLTTRADVDAARVATLGLSMGSTKAWWLAALDDRLKVCVDICCLTDFHELIKARGLDGHGIYYYVPSLLKHFDTSSINALIAPRAHLSLAGNYDSLTPAAGLDRVDANLRAVYAAKGAPEAWKLIRYEIGHFETAAMRREALAFLAQWL